MKVLLLYGIVLTVAVICPLLVTSQPQQRSISSNGNVSSNRNQSRNRETGSRMISTNAKGNTVQSDNNEEDEHDNSDTAFDNGPTPGRDSSEITFPIEDYYLPNGQPRHEHPTVVVETSTSSPTTRGTRWKQIPLNALLSLGSEPNIAQFFRKYVKNTKVVQDSMTYEEYLADSEGRPILNDKNEKVVVAQPPGGENQPQWRLQSSNLPFSNKPKGRNGQAVEARTRTFVNQALPPKSSISLPVCSPEVTTVPVPLESLNVDPSMLVIPKCLKVERCGGCCLSDLTVCEPEQREKAKFTVTLLGYDGDNEGAYPQLQFVNTTTVEVDRHTACKCKCRVKQEHCRSPFHKYEPNQCSCRCENTQAHQACLDNPGNRFWDNDTCQCTCQDVKVCSSGYYFSLNSCNCERQPSEYEMRQLKAYNRTRNLKPVGGRS